MTSRLSFKQSLCLTWETEKPSLDFSRTSPAFVFMDCIWYMKLNYEKNPYGSYYFINLIENSQLKYFPTLISSIYFVKKNGEFLFPQRNYISSSDNVAWTIDAKKLEQKIFDFHQYSGFTLVCIFETLNAATINRQLTGDKLKQVHSDSKKTLNKSVQVNFDSKQMLDQGIQASFDSSLTLKSFLRTENSSENPTLTFLDLPFSLDNLSQDLGNLLKDDLLPDIQLKIADFTIHAHRVILAARSKVFAAMFHHEMAERNTGIIDIKDIDAPVLKVFVNYLYSGKISEDNLSEDMVSNLYMAADKYSVNGLKKICSNFMIRNINEENCLSFLTLAHAFNDHRFKEAIACVIIKDDALLRNETWLKYAAENPVIAVDVYNKYFGK